jgi:hypothetical protein
LGKGFETAAPDSPQKLKNRLFRSGTLCVNSFPLIEETEKQNSPRRRAALMDHDLFNEFKSVKE